MATDRIPQLTFKFDNLVVARFDAEHASSDGGAVLLKALDCQLGLTEAVARCLSGTGASGATSSMSWSTW
jgi:hypothetical protein